MKNKSLIGIAAVIILIAAGVFYSFSANGSISSANTEANGEKVSKGKNGEEKSKNLIVLIGDGMGPAQVTLTRLYAQKYLDQDRLVMDDILVGQNSTYAGDSSSYKGESGIVTDSAASATAFGTGHKTYNGAISVTNEEVAKPVASIIEAAEQMGKSTGLISTARITHATPAAYGTHVRSRGNENAIASQYAESGIDVLFGGGERHFVSSEETATFGKTKRDDEVDLTQLFADQGYKVVNTKTDLMNVEGDKVLGLFNDSHIPYNLDREGKDIPTLADQLTKAIEILNKNEEGFVIMLEGGRIDHAGHANDPHSVIQETLEFDAAIKTALDFAEKDGNTSVMVTADHETGGLTIGSLSTYDAYLDVVKKVTASSEVIGKELEEAADAAAVREIVEKHTGINNLTEEEVELILSGKEWDGSDSKYGREGAFNAVISYRTLIGWTGHGHTGVDVNVYAYGPVAQYVTGFTDNTDFAKAGAKVIGADLEAATEKLQEKYLYPKFIITRDEKIIFPVNDLSEALGVEVAVETGAETVSIDGTEYTVTVDNDESYLPLEAFDAAADKELEWDALSERIIIK